MRLASSLAMAICLSLVAMPSSGQVPPYPSTFWNQDLGVNGTTIHVRVGGSGPAVVLRLW